MAVHATALSRAGRLITLIAGYCGIRLARPRGAWLADERQGFAAQNGKTRCYGWLPDPGGRLQVALADKGLQRLKNICPVTERNLP